MILFLRRHASRAVDVAFAPALGYVLFGIRLCAPLLGRFGSAVSSMGRHSLTFVSALAVALLAVGCAPAVDTPNPWSDYRPAAQSAPSVAPAVVVDEHPPQPPLSLNVGEAPRFELVEPNRNRAPQNWERAPAEKYPPPAPPAEESDSGAANANPDVPAHWTGAVIYCQPGCVPCAMQIRDLRKAGWKCGVGDRNHFKIVELLTQADFERRSVPSTPQTVYFVDGAEQFPRVTGYGGTTAELAALVNRHPRVKRSVRVGTAMHQGGCTCLSGGVCVCNENCQCAPLVSAGSTMSYGASPLWYEAAPLGCGGPARLSSCAAPTLAANCGAPAMASCAAPTSSFSAYSVPTTVTYAAPPVYFAAPTPVYAHSGATIGPATHSAQLNLFGFPLIGGSVGTTLNW
jgi:hypothetical protein